MPPSRAWRCPTTARRRMASWPASSRWWSSESIPDDRRARASAPLASGWRRATQGSATMTTTAWREAYEGGDAESERLVFQRLAVDLMDVQLKVRKRSKAAVIRRTFHSKAVFATIDAELAFTDDR